MHWFSIVNSLLIVLFLTVMVAMIMVRNLHRDIVRYNRVLSDEEKAEDREECARGVPYGAFTSLDGLVAISRCRGWFLFRV